MDKRTRENLFAALHGEAFAYARYSLFAAAARDRGEPDVAALFEGLAAVELREHFAELAALADLVGTDADNLAAAIQDENEEAEVGYPSFAAQAQAVGETAVADRFTEIAEDERAHAQALEGALEDLEAPV